MKVTNTKEIILTEDEVEKLQGGIVGYGVWGYRR